MVASFEELVNTPFSEGVNAQCWQRNLLGDFEEVVTHLLANKESGSIDEAMLKALPLSASGKLAVETLLEDQRLLAEHGLDPMLDLLLAYPRDEVHEALRTDVYSWHADSAPVEADTYLCTYYGPTSQGLRNEEAQLHIDIPETRARLLKIYGGEDDKRFSDYLKENCYDLHYAALPEAQPYSFGLCNLWRIAIKHPSCPVPPCVHRAPDTIPGQTRLLLIS
jgi:hypothetical protein